MKHHAQLSRKDRTRLRNWKRWGAYLADIEWALRHGLYGWSGADRVATADGHATWS